MIEFCCGMIAAVAIAVALYAIFVTIAKMIDGAVKDAVNDNADIHYIEQQHTELLSRIIKVEAWIEQYERETEAISKGEV